MPNRLRLFVARLPEVRYTVLCAVVPAALLCCLVGACVPPDPGAADRSRALAVDLADPTLRRIADLQDRMAVDSLLAYLGAAEPEQRFLAARAFGSHRYDSAVAPLTSLLADPILEVRAMAAYALGQQGAARAAPALTAAFEAYDTAGFYAPFHRALLEAIGKTGDTASLRALATVSTYGPADTLLQLGRMQGIYRLALRGMTSSAGTAAALAVATDDAHPHRPRLYGAHYAARADVDLRDYGARLLAALGPALRARAGDTSGVDLAVALSLALGKTDDDAVAAALPELLRQAGDVRTEVALLRSAGGLSVGRPELRALLRENALDTALWVAQTAAAQLLEYGVAEEARDYWRLGRDSAARAASPALYAAALRHLPRGFTETRGYINGQLLRALRQPVAERAAVAGRAAVADPAAEVYYRADVLRALGEYPFNYRFLVARALDETAPRAERTAAAEALDRIARRDDIVDYLRGSLRTFRREYADYFRRVFASDDASLQAVAAGTITAPALDFATAFEEGVGEVLAQAQRRLQLPQATETYYAIDEARARLDDGYEAAREPPAYNHAVNWDIYRSLQPGLEVVIATPRGEIVVDLLEDAAPATVVNFVQLVRTGFYNGKGFHRVVPGFVTQGGDPGGDGYGGDGYGALDFTVRSETPPLYYDGAGYVGMASAGPHTEGVQFFITHAAAPHLDGRYAIFGRVTEGMDVVLALRRGDEMRARLR